MEMDDLRNAMTRLLETKPNTARRLFVPPCHYAKGEAWVREQYQVGPDVTICETRPMPIS